jgi:NAD(P)-dependent dehydrogenase (short-subunit alcohol dehydrogenase family)
MRKDGVPRSQFNAKSTAEDVTAGLDLTGKVALVTGCTSGIGFETMRVLAMRGASVIGTSRSLEKARAAGDRVEGATVPLQLELSDFQSVVKCAESVRSLHSSLDMLICNAGFLGGSGQRSLVNGVEKHFVVNHLGHFVLVNRLLDRLSGSRQGRVVVVASGMAYSDAPASGIQFDDLALAQGYRDRRAYAHSKLANVLFSLELSRRLRGSRVTSNSLHPGMINTEIDRHMNRFMQFGFRIFAGIFGKSIEEGAATNCFVSTSPLLSTTSGRYFENCNAVSITGNHHMQDESMAARLWQMSEELTKDYLVAHGLPELQSMAH